MVLHVKYAHGCGRLIVANPNPFSRLEAFGNTSDNGLEGLADYSEQYQGVFEST